MNLEYDAEADAVYITLREDIPFARGYQMDMERVIDFGPDDMPIGIELLNVQHGVDVRGLPDEDAVAALLRQHEIQILASTEATYSTPGNNPR